MLLRLVTVIFLLLYTALSSIAQCPPNIGFEEGSFNKWLCYTGPFDSTGTLDQPPQPPIADRHKLIKKENDKTLDFYGRFPVNCPNGSGYSIRLGNEHVGGESERVSYVFTIPADKDVFSLIYNYAVVFQNPGHLPHEQPRFTAKVFDMATKQYIECSSFDYAAASDLPGFEMAPQSMDVFYKPWSQVTLKLVGYAGKTMRIDFTTHDCTKGGHFGYAYLDIDEDCTSPVKGNTYCIGSTSVTLTAPFGFKEYRWYDSTFSQPIGIGNSLHLTPPPPPGTSYMVQVIPYPGSGCPDTLSTTIAYAAVPFDFTLEDSIATCAPATIDITNADLRKGSSPGLQYFYFSDSTQREYLINPGSINKAGIFFIKAANSYGCNKIKPIKAIFHSPPAITVQKTLTAYWPRTADVTQLSLIQGNNAGLQFSYWRDASASIQLNAPSKIDQPGTYFIKATNLFGCSKINAIQVSITPPPPPNAFSPNSDGINDVWRITGLQVYPQCMVSVYDRWGRAVYYSVGYQKPWDGSLNGKPLPPGTYYYSISLSSSLKPLLGTIFILR